MLLPCALTLLISSPAGDEPVATPKGAEAPSADEAKDAVVDDSVEPQEQKDAFKLFTGTWRCDGKAATELAPDVATRFTLRFRADLGRWLSVHVDEQKSKDNPHAIKADELWGFSKALGGFVQNGADSQGGFYRGTSSGWVGDRFWWTIDSAKNGKPVKLKVTFTKAEDGKSFSYERAIDPSNTGDSFRVFYDGTCKH